MESESVLPPADTPAFSPASSPSGPGGLESFDWAALLAGAREYKAGILLLTPAITIFLWFFVSYQLSPLKKYPGPFLAGSSPLSLIPTPKAQLPRTCMTVGLRPASNNSEVLAMLTFVAQDGPISGGFTTPGLPTMAPT